MVEETVKQNEAVSDSQPVAVLVHGAWHGSWCWEPVVELLAARGRRVETIDLPSRDDPAGSLHGDAAAVRRLTDSLEGPVVLVGHSYGGAVITEASAGSANIRRLVYLTALVLDEGETPAEGGRPDDAAEIPSEVAATAMRVNADGTVAPNPEVAVDLFYHDCDPETAARAVERLVSQGAATLAEPPAGAGWKHISSTYVVCEDDHVLVPATQWRLAKRCTATVTLPTSHSPFLSRPESVAEVIEAELES